MEVIGIEPTTSCLQSRRSPNWATPPTYTTIESKEYNKKKKEKRKVKFHLFYYKKGLVGDEKYTLYLKLKNFKLISP